MPSSNAISLVVSSSHNNLTILSSLFERGILAVQYFLSFFLNAKSLIHLSTKILDNLQSSTWWIRIFAFSVIGHEIVHAINFSAMNTLMAQSFPKQNKQTQRLLNQAASETAAWAWQAKFLLLNDPSGDHTLISGQVEYVKNRSHISNEVSNKYLNQALDKFKPRKL